MGTLYATMIRKVCHCNDVAGYVIKLNHFDEKKRFCKLQIKTFNEIWLNHVSLHSHNYLNWITASVIHSKVHVNIRRPDSKLGLSCRLSHWIKDHHHAPGSQTCGENRSESVLISCLITERAWTSSPAANIIWTTVPIDAGPPRRMTLCACMPTYPPEASSPPPERTRQPQQSPNSGFLVACGVTGLDCGGRLDMFRLKCVKSKRIQVPKAPLYWHLVF